MYNQRCYAIAQSSSCRSRDASISRRYDYAHEKDLQWQSVAIRGHQWQSVAISRNQHEKELQWQSVAIRGHQWPSVAISGNQHEKELQSVRQS
jgi:hypothetical protein